MNTIHAYTGAGVEVPPVRSPAVTRSPVIDFIAIGLGPFNLSLACLADPIRDLRGIFLERNEHFDWHPGMLIDDCTLQNPFLADLVSLADPKSKFSFLNYCKQEGKLYAYYIRERFYLSRAEFVEFPPDSRILFLPIEALAPSLD